MEKLGDKITSKIVAKEAGVATIPGIEKPIRNEEEALLFAKSCGYPVMIKAAAGGGGRGMRIAQSQEELLENSNLPRVKPRRPLATIQCLLKNIFTSQSTLKCKFWETNMGM